MEASQKKSGTDVRIGTIILVVGLLALTACGGGGGGSSSGSSGSGSLGFRVVWQQSANGQSAALSGRGTASASPALPAEVKAISVEFESDSNALHCCVGIDPATAPVDADGHFSLVLATLPLGGATVTVAGFPTNAAGASAGGLPLCATDPANVGQPCTSQADSPNFRSSQHVTIQSGQQTNIEIIVSPVTPTPIGPLPTATPTVRVLTPTPHATRTGTVAPVTLILKPGDNIANAASRVPAGSTLILSPGLYSSVVLNPGDLAGSLTMIADVTGAITASPPAPVTINGRGVTPALQLSGQQNVLVDGLTLRGGGSAGVLIQNSSGIVLRNATVTESRGDGIHVDGSDTVLIFDNLTYANSGAGIGVGGSTGLQIINNTVYGNGDTGISIGSSNNTLAENNIVDMNTGLGIVVDTASSAFQGDYNLNTDGYGADTPTGAHDVAIGPESNPLFVFPPGGDFHLARGIAGSTSPAIDAGDPATNASLVAQLAQRSTQSDGTLDTPPVDLGFHYPAAAQ